MEKVVVLLSTYNGERFLEQQLDSIFAQKGIFVEVLVRDDGSTDGTIKILQKWRKTHNLKWYTGENLKPARSYLNLIKNAPKSDYYAFADQDDYWYENKLTKAVSCLKHHGNTPSIFISNYDIADKNLNIIGKRKMNFDIPYTLQSTIIDRCPSGCMMVFNEKLMRILKRKTPEFIRMHDYWTLLVVEAFYGKIITSDESLLMYRQHDNNVVGHTEKWIIKLNRLINSAFKNKNERLRQAKSLYDCYAHEMPKISKKELEKIVFYKDSLNKTLKVAFSKDYRTVSTLNNLLFKVSVLLHLF